MSDLIFENDTNAHLLKWVQRLKENVEYKNIRFKKLNVSYPLFTFSKELIDIVDNDEFLTIEKERIPLFIGSQFGLSPNIQLSYNENKEIRVAILAKSWLSGVVYGLVIYEIIPRIVENNSIIVFDKEKIIEFLNK